MANVIFVYGDSAQIFTLPLCRIHFQITFKNKLQISLLSHTRKKKHRLPQLGVWFSQFFKFEFVRSILFNFFSLSKKIFMFKLSFINFEPWVYITQMYFPFDWSSAINTKRGHRNEIKGSRANKSICLSFCICLFPLDGSSEQFFLLIECMKQ